MSFSDSFTRADENPLASPYGLYTGLNACRLVSNQVAPTATEGGFVYQADSIDVGAQGEFTPVGGTAYGLTLGTDVVDVGSYLQLIVAGSSWSLDLKVGFSIISLDSGSFSPGSTVTLYLSHAVGTWTARIDGSTIYTGDAGGATPSGPYVGVYMESTGARFDNLDVGGPWLVAGATLERTVGEVRWVGGPWGVTGATLERSTGQVGWGAPPPQPGDTWWAQLVTSYHVLLAKIPMPSLGVISETLNDITTVPAQVVVAANREAARVLAENWFGVLPDVELQIWRGRTLWYEGPVVNADRPDAWDIQTQDPMWWLTRRGAGRQGYNYAGWHGDPDPTQDYFQNPQFADGLTGWSLLHTEGNTTPDTPVTPASAADPGVVFVDVGADPPGPGLTVIGWDTPVALFDQYHLYQDLTVRTLSDAPLGIRAAIYVKIPSTATFAPTSLPAGLSLGYLPYPVTSQDNYVQQMQEVVTKPITADIARDKWILLETDELQVPPNTGAVLHWKISFPQGQGQLAIATWPTADDGGMTGIDYEAAQFVSAHVYQAQRADLDKTPVNIAANWTPTGKKVTRTWAYSQHPSHAEGIMGLSREGYYDWWFEYRLASRVICAAPLRGQYRPECRITNRTVTNVRPAAQWAQGATRVALQAQDTQMRHEVAAALEGTTAIEDTSTADRETTPADLPSRAAERLAKLSRPITLQVTGHPGSTLTTTIRPGDWTDVLVDLDGFEITGVFRVVRKETDPMTDRATLTLNPFTPPEVGS